MNKIKAITSRVINDLNLLDKNSKEFQDKYLFLFPMLRDLHYEEIKEFLENTGLALELETINKNAEILIESVENFGINFKTLTIDIKSGDEEISSPLKDVKQFLIKKINKDPDTWEFTLALSCFIQPDTYEKFQLVHALILED